MVAVFRKATEVIQQRCRDEICFSGSAVSALGICLVLHGFITAVLLMFAGKKGRFIFLTARGAVFIGSIIISGSFL